LILNISRSQQWQACKRKAWFYDEGFVQLGVAEPLITGSAYHKGTANLVVTKNVAEAKAAAEQCYRDELAKVPMVLPEEMSLHNQNITIVKRMLDAQGAQYARDTWTVLKPEVEFLVALPGTEHHCYYVHRILHPGEACSSVQAPCQDPRCIQPHYLKGRTDGILSWNNLIWILERKTSGMKQNIFWDQWYLNHQLSAYVYGARKATGLEINGVVLEKMPKPARNQNPLTFDFSPEREPYLRSESDLAKFEREIIRITSDYERCASDPDQFEAFYRNPQACCNYNRRCDYWSACKRDSGRPEPGEFRTRDADYVEKAYYEVLGLPLPPGMETACSSVENVVVD